MIKSNKILVTKLSKSGKIKSPESSYKIEIVFWINCNVNLSIIISAITPIEINFSYLKIGLEIRLGKADIRTREPSSGKIGNRLKTPKTKLKPAVNWKRI